MKNYVKSVALVLALLAGASASAAPVYNYSYQFKNGSVISGSFNGVANGDVITDLTNITAALDGTAFPASYVSYQKGSPVSSSAQASFSGTGNNFMFSDLDYANTISYNVYFRFLSNNIVDFYDTSTSKQLIDWYPSTARWSLVAVNEAPADVPEPGSYALMLAGAGMMGLTMRRRRNNQS